MITVAIAEVFYLRRVLSAVGMDRRRERTARRADARASTSASPPSNSTPARRSMSFLAFCYFVGIVIALRIVRSPVGAILSAIRDNPLRAAAVGHNIHGYKLTAFVIAAAYAGFAGGLLGVMQAFMPPDAFTFDTSGQLVMQTAIGGAGTLFGPLRRRRGLAVPAGFPAGRARARRRLEAGARPGVRAAGLLPAPRHHRRHRGSLSGRYPPGRAEGGAARRRSAAGDRVRRTQRRAHRGRGGAGRRRHAGARGTRSTAIAARSCRRAA